MNIEELQLFFERRGVELKFKELFSNKIDEMYSGRKGDVSTLLEGDISKLPLQI